MHCVIDGVTKTSHELRRKESRHTAILRGKLIIESIQGGTAWIIRSRRVRKQEHRYSIQHEHPNDSYEAQLAQDRAFTSTGPAMMMIRKKKECNYEVMTGRTAKRHHEQRRY